MKCDSKVMFKTAIGFSVVLAAAYFVFPEIRTWLVASGPFLLFLICPVTMFVMMKSMNLGNEILAPVSSKAEALPQTPRHVSDLS